MSQISKYFKDAILNRNDFTTVKEEPLREIYRLIL